MSRSTGGSPFLASLAARLRPPLVLVRCGATTVSGPTGARKPRCFRLLVLVVDVQEALQRGLIVFRDGHAEDVVTVVGLVFVPLKGDVANRVEN